MTHETIRLKRDDLYEQVWTRPLRDIAKDYSLSDVGLGKICRRLNIPVPGRGYWAKKNAGTAPSRIPLPPIAINEQHEVVLDIQKMSPPDPAQQTEADRLIAFEKAPDNRVVVAQNLCAPHVLAARTEKSLRAAKPDEKGLICPRAKGCFNIRISAGCIDRAMRILDALAKALDARKLPLVTGDNQVTHVTLLGIRHELSIEESTVRKVREPTPAERKRQKRNPWLFGAPQYEYLATGRLTIRILGYGSGQRRSWSDGRQKSIEDRLNTFIIGLINVSVATHAENLERERRHREWEDQVRRRHEEEQRRQLEESRRASLDKQINAWRKSREIRVYVAAVSRAAAEKQGAIMPESNLGQWIDWASRYADSLDPLLGNLAMFQAEVAGQS